MEYPREFSTEAEAKVEGARIRAEKQFDGLKNGLDLMGHGSPSDVEGLLRKYILAVLAAFAHEACELGRQGTWKVTRIDAEVDEFLRRITLRAYSERGYDTNGRRLSEAISHISGGIREDLRKQFRQSLEWSRYQDELLEITEVQAHPVSVAIQQKRPVGAPAPRVQPQPDGEVATAATAGAKTIGERLDDARLNADISHEEQAARIGISRSAYFEVKAGRGGRKSRRSTEKYLKGLATNK
jgi:hypothetical protein